MFSSLSLAANRCERSCSSFIALRLYVRTMLESSIDALAETLKLIKSVAASNSSTQTTSSQLHWSRVSRAANTKSHNPLLLQVLQSPVNDGNWHCREQSRCQEWDAVANTAETKSRISSGCKLLEKSSVQREPFALGLQSNWLVPCACQIWGRKSGVQFRNSRKHSRLDDRCLPHPGRWLDPLAWSLTVLGTLSAWVPRAFSISVSLFFRLIPSLFSASLMFCCVTPSPHNAAICACVLLPCSRTKARNRSQSVILCRLPFWYWVMARQVPVSFARLSHKSSVLRLMFSIRQTEVLRSPRVTAATAFWRKSSLSRGRHLSCYYSICLS